MKRDREFTTDKTRQAGCVSEEETLEAKTGRPINIQVIGTIQTHFKEASGTPIQAVYGQGAEGRVLVHEPFVPALDDIEDFERLWLIYWMDRVGPFRPKIIPYRDNTEHGLFATRSPTRPNPVGLSVVRLIRREGSVLHVADIDIPVSYTHLTLPTN